MLRSGVTVVAICAQFVSAGGLGAADGALQGDEVAIQSCLEGIRDYNSSGRDKPARDDECIGTVADPCLERPEGQSTAGMVVCYGREIAVWDDLLNSHYSALKDGLDTASFEALRDSQRKWIAYRDAKCEWPYVFFEGGTIASPIGSSCMNEATARRANELADYLEWL